VDAVLKANIASILGLTLPSGAAFLLDTYTGAVAAYSVRRLATAATVLLRVRRDTAGGTGDDDEADVAYDSNNILSLDSAISNASAGVTATTLGEFINVGTVGGTTYSNPDSLTGTAIAYVPEWTDQSGNNADATQATHSVQRRIHDGTTNGDLEQSNGKPTLFGPSGGGFSASLPNTTQPFCCMVFDKDTSDFSTWHSANANWMALGDAVALTNVSNGMGTLTAYKNGSQMTLSTRTQFKADIGSDQLLFTHTTTASITARTWYFAQYFTSATAYNIRPSLQENIMWGTDQSSNRSGIEENINSEFLIYQPTDTPTSGLLATYSGAAAAYSVRQLANTAVIAMTVRRDSDDEEKRFGFDANGDLDTAGIASFCGSANGYVSQWWDQSTNGNHASQGTAVNQPQIYDGTAVITENGKPALFVNGNASINGNALYASGFGTGNTRYFSYVARMTQDSSPGDYHNPVMFLQTAPNTAGTNFFQTYTTNASNSISVNYPTAALDMSNTTATNVQHLLSLQKTSTDSEFWIDGTSQDTATGTQNLEDELSIGKFQNYGRAVMRFQELVVWNTDQDGAGNRTGIETNINSYFSIY